MTSSAGRRLVGDQHVGLANQRDGDHHALTHAAAEFERVLPQPLFHVRHADFRQHVASDVHGLLLVDLAMQQHGLGDLVADAMHGREGGHRFLEDHADLPAADFEQCVRLIVQCSQIGRQPSLVLVQNLPAGNPTRFLDQAQDRIAGDALAAAAFADEGNGLATRQIKAHAADGLRRAVDRVEHDFQIAHGQHVVLSPPPVIRGRARERVFCVQGRHSKLQTLSLTLSRGTGRGDQNRYLDEYGSAASRRPSPMKLKQSTVATMASTGIISHG